MEEKPSGPQKPIDESLRLVIDTIPALVARSQPDGSVDFINQRWLQFTGLRSEDLLGWAWPEVLHPEDAARFVGELRASLAGGQPFENEVRIRRADGEYRWFRVRRVPLRDERGRIVHWYGTAHDIQDSKEAEARLRQSEDRLRLVIDTTPALLHSARPDGYLDYFNKPMLDYLGVSLDDVCGWRWTNSIHPDDVEDIVATWRASLETGEPFEAAARVRRADGEYRWQLHRKVPLRDAAGTIVKWYGSSIDIDDRKRADDEVKALKDQLYKENLALKEEVDQASMFEEIIGSSAALRRVLVLVAKVAPTDSTVLITGETGTGKELFARAVHKRSRRAGRVFVSVNCAAIPPSLIASELFGYEKGAFTGATQRRVGRFELASGGTLFLDEIGELPSETQVTLLRVLQERAFERVGGNQPIAVDVRVIAATNRDLQAAVEAGTFRSDLFYRLNVFPIRVPPLRDRIEDVPLLVEYLTGRYASKAGKKIRSVKKQTMELLREYDWPGNVRELQNVVERAVILCDGDTLSVDESWLKREPERPGAARKLGRPDVDQERQMIETALTDSQGRVSGSLGAAAKLGIPRSTLESRIRSLGINKHRFKSA